MRTILKEYLTTILLIKVLEAPYNYAEKLLIMPKKHMSFKSYMLKKLGKHVLFHRYTYLNAIIHFCKSHLTCTVSDFQQRLMDSLKEFQPSFIQHVDPVQMKELIQGLYEVDKSTFHSHKLPYMTILTYYFSL